ncbi:hypothetical protein QR680_011533 [Steinernema hermaphroditum]|uniref:Uncharacterized protein n=1 Tax=Steinernema hermaphroditum TaxID=289476 RepID=A0AA39I1E7_9BILA|nr:hypothetical protein QR680_011533 [Steinernema hermaphroditum]
MRSILLLWLASLGALATEGPPYVFLMSISEGISLLGKPFGQPFVSDHPYGCAQKWKKDHKTVKAIIFYKETNTCVAYQKIHGNKTVNAAKERAYLLVSDDRIEDMCPSYESVVQKVFSNSGTSDAEKDGLHGQAISVIDFAMPI